MTPKAIVSYDDTLNDHVHEGPWPGRGGPGRRGGHLLHGLALLLALQD